MRVRVTVEVRPDNEVLVVQKEASIILTPGMRQLFIEGQYPERLQLLIEAAIPQMVKGAIKEAMAR